MNYGEYLQIILTNIDHTLLSARAYPNIFPVSWKMVLFIQKVRR